MRNIGLVIRHEIVSTLGKPSFWLTTFVFPLVIMAFSLGTQFLSVRAIEDSEALVDVNSGQPAAIGYVDHAALIQILPEGVPSELVYAFPDEASAQRALEVGDLLQYYVIAADYLQSGKVEVVERTFSPLGNISTIGLFTYILDANLIDDVQLLERISEPIADLESVALEIPVTSDAGILANASDAFEARFIVGYGVLFIFFFVFMMSSTFMLRSVSREKENRTVEVLLVSLRPRELMLGKVLGLGFVALLQLAVWLGGSIWVYQRGDGIFRALGMMVKGLTLPSGFLFWAAIYFLLGYVLYASILAAIGALAPSARETGQFTFIAMLPLMIPLWMNTAFYEAPNGSLATALSLFPLTAPTSMLPRLAAGGVPLWQPIVGLVLLAITTYGFVLLSARFFRADTLLSSSSLNWKRFVEEYRKGEKRS
ncbi:MAG: ABC transporter permease [Anaerolineae bacterium]|nr:ABC transporter permease [Anaerolineae bacterium]